MKPSCGKIGLCLALLALGALTPARAWAETNGSPVRVAIISEPDVSASMPDLLTAELSRRPDIQLLERAQIEKIYREQGLSAANQDFLKLGQILGADGLLLLTRCLNRNISTPLIVPLRFDLAREPKSSDAAMRWSFNLTDATRRGWMALTRDALVVGRVTSPGFWFIPRTELDERFKKMSAELKRAMRTAETH